MTRLQKYSFDVFDTVLTRVVSRPVDIFRYMQRELVKDEQIPEDLRRKFVPARVWAEFISRRRTSKEDVSLPAIYEVLGRDYCLSQPVVQSLVNKELEIEERCLVPIRSQIERIKEIHSSGESVVFVSDMYLPEVFIEAQLKRFDIYAPGDCLYVSGELGITKGSGKLFKYVLDKENLMPEQLIHCGDNPHSDVIVPRQLGIKLDEATSTLAVRVGFLPGFTAKVRYAGSLLQSRWKLGVRRVA